MFTGSLLFMRFYIVSFSCFGNQKISNVLLFHSSLVTLATIFLCALKIQNRNGLLALAEHDLAVHKI